MNQFSIPNLSVPPIDQKTGLWNKEWLMFFISLFQASGSGSSSASITDLIGLIETQRNQNSSNQSQPSQYEQLHLAERTSNTEIAQLKTRIENLENAAYSRPHSFNSFANPSAMVGLTPVNGASSNAMRSDAAPAIDQNIAPTWTSPHIFTKQVTIGDTNLSSFTLCRIGNTNPLTATTQNCIQVTWTGTSDSTMKVRGMDVGVGTEASAFVCPVAINYESEVITKGIGSTITRAIGFKANQQTDGTHNAAISDTEGFFGNWNLNFAGTNPSLHMGSFVISAGLSTSATDGFLYIPSCAGAPTGIPTPFTGTAPAVYDRTNNKLYAYNGGWKSVTLT